LFHSLIFHSPDFIGSALSLDIKYLPRCKHRLVAVGCQNGDVLVTATDLSAFIVFDAVELLFSPPHSVRHFMCTFSHCRLSMFHFFFPCSAQSPEALANQQQQQQHPYCYRHRVDGPVCSVQLFGPTCQHSIASLIPEKVHCFGAFIFFFLFSIEARDFLKFRKIPIFS
jgi:hypothetical protein